MLTSHSSWEEWFPPRLRGLAYLTSHIFTMVASAPLGDHRSEFQTSWVITDFLEKPLLTGPNLPPSRPPLQDLFPLPGFPCSAADDLNCFPLAVIFSNHTFFPSISSSDIFWFLPSFIYLTFNLLLMTVMSLWVSAKLFSPSFIPPTKPLWYLRQPRFTLTEAPACGSMLYFFWMKGLKESAFLFPVWAEAALCLRVHVSRPSLG